MFKIEQPSYEPHPVGRHTGQITEVRDQGIHENTWDGRTWEVHKVSIHVVSDSAFRDDGTPFQVSTWFTLSSSPKSNLRKFREAVLDRSLTRQEELEFDHESELIGKKISYRIDHKARADGTMRAVIRDGSVEPVNEAVPFDVEEQAGGSSSGH